MKNYLRIILIIIALFPALGIAQTSGSKPRTIITTDGEVDDQDSFIRMLLYANEFTIEGLVYSSSQWHYKGDGNGTKFKSEMEMTADRYGERTDLRWPGTAWMESMIDKYATVYDNLTKHASGYPTPDRLKRLIRIGNIDFEGEMEKDTPGSDFIKSVILDGNPEPVYMQIWGGTNTVARALKAIEDQYKTTAKWEAIQAQVNSKVILYAVLDQDATYKKYIEGHWPKIRVLYNAAQFWNFAYPWPRVVPKPLQAYLRGPWFRENIKFNHGALMSAYYLWGDGTVIENDPEHNQGDTAVMRKFEMGKYDFISEGDSPAYFHLVNVGLDNLGDASFGGWGGRMIKSSKNPNRWEDGDNVTDYNPYIKKQDKAYPQTRWIEVLQNDFAARADWCVMPLAKANHPPVARLKHAKTFTAKRGDKVKLSGITSDVDGNKIAVRWWQYGDVDTYESEVNIVNSSKLNCWFTIPLDARPGDTFHMIMEAKDDGKPMLTRYQRVIVTVQ